jgi:hypothetical protein
MAQPTASLAAPFTEAEFIAEVRDTLVSFADQLGRFYDHKGAWQLLGMDPASKDFPEFEYSTDGVDAERFHLVQEARLLYRYAYGAFASADLDWSVVTEDTHAFVLAMEAFARQQCDDFYASQKLRVVLDLALARSKVAGDNDSNLPAKYYQEGGTEFGSISLRQMALLAGVDEKTIRNAASAHSKNRLITKSVMGRTFVDVDVAKAWLTARGQWIDIQYENRAAARDLARHPFYSSADLQIYVEDRLSDVLGGKVTTTAAATDPRVPADIGDWLIAIGQGQLPGFEPHKALSTARFLQVDEGAFATAFLKLAHDAQLEALAATIRASSTDASPANADEESAK